MTQRYWHVWDKNDCWGIFTSSIGDTPDPEIFPYQRRICEPVKPEEQVHRDGWYLVLFGDKVELMLREKRGDRAFDYEGKEKAEWSSYKIVGAKVDFELWVK